MSPAELNYNDLSLEVLENHINEIVSGEKLVYIVTSNGSAVPMILLHPYPSDLLRSKHVYDTTLAQAKVDGLMDYDSMDDVLLARGLYTEDDKDAVEKKRSQMRGQKKLLPRYTVVPQKREQIHENINRMAQEIREIEMKRERYLLMTDEYKARESQLLYTTWACCYHFINDDLYWPTYEYFVGEPDVVFRRNAVAEVSLLTRGKSIKLIRFISRSNLWRLRFSPVFKYGGELFSRKNYQHTVDMMALSYWSLFYQSIYEMMPDDQPSESVIEDDDALDAYLEELHRTRSRERVSGKQQGKKGVTSAYDHGEVIITKQDPYYKDAPYTKQRKRDKNSDGSKATMLSEKERLGQNKERLRKRRVGTSPEKKA